MERNAEGIYPPNTDYKSLAELPYNFSSYWEKKDLIFKIPILECELRIGDKTCCEFNDEWGNPVYQWLTDEQIPETIVDGVAYKMNKIFLGCNPKIDDNIVGVEYDFTNTVTAQMNIDAKGIAIPVKQSDMLNGKLSFKIVKPVYLEYN